MAILIARGKRLEISSNKPPIPEHIAIVNFSVYGRWGQAGGTQSSGPVLKMADYPVIIDAGFLFELTLGEPGTIDFGGAANGVKYGFFGVT